MGWKNMYKTFFNVVWRSIKNYLEKFYLISGPNYICIKLLCVHDLRVQPLVQQLSWNVALLINGCFTSILSSILVNLSGNELELSPSSHL